MHMASNQSNMTPHIESVFDEDKVFEDERLGSIHPAAPILSYCVSSMGMSVVHMYILSPNFKLLFFFVRFQVIESPSRLLKKVS